MSLIVCSKKCAHQQEGYCSLDEISHVTASVGEDCAYFEALSLDSAPSKGLASLGDIADPNQF